MKLIGHALVASLLAVAPHAASAPASRAFPPPPPSTAPTPPPQAMPADSPLTAWPTWAEQMERLKAVGERVLAESGRTDTVGREQDMQRYILGAIADGYLNYVNKDPNRPTWTPLWNAALNYGGPNPDYAYMSTLIDPKGVYRISGRRGTIRFVDITEKPAEYINNRFGFSDKGYTTPAVYDLDSLQKDKDGYFSVILSAERPTGYTGDWWKLHANTRSLTMRKASYDWRHEIDPKVAIERLDPAPPVTNEAATQRFSSLDDFVHGIIELDTKLTRYYRDNHGINTIKISKMRGNTSYPGQTYLDGAFELKDDEALILETAVPDKCRYWQVLLADDRFATIDWVNRQSSLNGYQAKLDTDGKFRAVISHLDPGVPNWLDTAGEPWGILQMRWNRCSSAPEPTVKKVALKDVRKYVPADTPVVTPDVRNEQLRDRREAYQFRQLW
jgi:hypothetical protein